MKSWVKYFFEPQRHKGPKLHQTFVVLSVLLSSWFNLLQAQRQDILLNDNWQTIANDSNQHAFDGFELSSYKTTNWKTVNVPHNWDAYEGYRRMLHGNKHGYAWYKKPFTVNKQNDKRYFLFFEGVGSYATVWLNGKQVGSHEGGRTTFTIDVTNEILSGKKNDLAIRADHPSNIKDLAWVCGGCSDERGFSEGSQPMGIFRPVHLIVTDEVRIEPFGVHVWNDETANAKSATLNVEINIKNYATKPKTVAIITELINKEGIRVAKEVAIHSVYNDESVITTHLFDHLANVHLWNLDDPYLYKVVTSIMENGKIIDKVVTPYGIRTIKWDRGKSNRFFLNGKPIFINGIAEYEHLLGSSHSFSNEQIASRAKMVKQLGFNAFRDAHQPHNLLYQHYWDSLGILSWTQHSAHVWYDTKEFRDNFKTLLKEWVIERRNSPSIILWGLQNESKLPKDFAEECTILIRSLDPTASSQRLITTCNGGEGTDWDVPQNWTGTYGGNPYKYDEDVKRQVLIGEYGAWRTLDLHTEGNFSQNGPLSEDRFTQLMETKIRLAEQVKDSAAGHFHWLLTSHDNPGRVQGGEGLRELDRIGPVNYKGLLTPWEEPTDAYYMYKSNYASNKTDAMVYIVSHTWPSRWKTAGKKDSIIVYSNCDEVELFNDVNHLSLGKKKKGAIGTHFQWDGVNIQYNVLYAVGYVNGKAVVKDYIVLNHFPKAPRFNDFYKGAKNVTMPKSKYHYMVRVNCGADLYKDSNGHYWYADRYSSSKQRGASYVAASWTDDFKEMPASFADQRRTFSPVQGTKDGQLFQSFRFGRDKLAYSFRLPKDKYIVELYFVEPWLGVGSNSNCKGMRVFDIAINNKTVLHNLDIWSEVGTNRVLKKTFNAEVVNENGSLDISFPKIMAGQVVIAAIAIARLDPEMWFGPMMHSPVTHRETYTNCTERSWLDIGSNVFGNDSINFNSLPSNLFGAEWLQLNDRNQSATFEFSTFIDVDFFIALGANAAPPLDSEPMKTEIITDENGGTVYNVYRRRIVKGKKEKLTIASNSIVVMIPVSSMQPAYDLKSISSYRPLQATVSTDAERTTINTKDAITFKSNIASLEWNISTGVADVYSITIRYANETGKELKAIMQLLQADGTLMKEEALNFTPSKTGKWNYATTNTGSMINAGNYIIKIKAVDAIGLSISALDIQ
jgi:beta-galactosidase